MGKLEFWHKVLGIFASILAAPVSAFAIYSIYGQPNNEINNDGFGLIAIIFFFFILVIFCIRTFLKKENSKNNTKIRSILLSILKDSNLYIVSVNKLQDFIDTVIGDKSRVAVTCDCDIDKNKIQKNRHFLPEHFNGFNPFNESCYSFCLALAFVYPVFGFVIPWLFGSDGSLAGFQLLPVPEQEKIFFKFWLVFLVIVAVIAGWKSSLTRNSTQNKTTLLSTLWLVCSILSVVIANYALAFPLVVIFGIAANSVLAGVRSGIESTLIVIFLTAVLAVIVSFASDIGAGVTIFIGGCTFAGLNAFWNWFRSRQKHGKRPTVLLIWVWHIGWLSLLLFIIAVLPDYAETVGQKAVIDIRTLLFLFAVLPLINAPLDWLSLGITRGLLFSITNRQSKSTDVFYTVLDVILAAIFWLLTIIITISILAFLDNLWGGVGLGSFDVSTLIKRLGENPWDINNLWVHILALTTLLPTFIHFIVASFALVNIASSIVRNKFIPNPLGGETSNKAMVGVQLNIATVLIILNIGLFLVGPIYILLSADEIKNIAGEYIASAAQAFGTIF